MKHIVTTDNATGNVVGQWSGGDEQTLASVPGRTHREIPGDVTDYSRKRWNGAAFEDLPAPPLAVSAYAFIMELFTAAERKTIRQKARGDAIASPPVPPDDDIADYVHRLDLKAAVNEAITLNSPKVAAGLDLLIAKGVLTTTRKAQIIAGKPPGGAPAGFSSLE